MLDGEEGVGAFHALAVVGTGADALAEAKARKVQLKRLMKSILIKNIQMMNYLKNLILGKT